MVIYNAKIVPVNNDEDVSSNRFSQPPGILCDIVLSMGCPEKIKTCRANFNHVLYVSIHVDPVDGLICQQPCLF